ncbi:CocE/NonD family hydrolase [Agathobaculum butyriciproducens]|uniref:CocE/NonD family hydrolase n=1 Tax=Agathobaculum butyriciproducens TaxID=1628085 RepID=UPI001D08F917|nr:S-layer homology domain-containing protein [Agathobaculum butyriciproducens]
MKKRAASLALVLSMILSFTCQAGAVDAKTETQLDAVKSILEDAGMQEKQFPNGDSDYIQMAKSLTIIGDNFKADAECTADEKAAMQSKATQIGLKTAIENGEPLFVNGVAQPIFPYTSGVPTEDGYSNVNSDIIRYSVYVETNYDTDGDGKLDLVKALVQLPRAAAEGKYKAAAIYDARPYITGCTDNGDDRKFTYKEGDLGYDLNSLYGSAKYQRVSDREMSTMDAAEKAKAEEWYYVSPYESGSWGDFYDYEDLDWYDYFLVRGYAVVEVGGLGTRGSEGLETCGADVETDAFKCVVEWLAQNSSRVAYTDKKNNIQIKADWSNGNVAMTGRSYGGTTDFAVASTGVANLKTIVPVAGIASWYEYTNSQGISTGSNPAYSDNLGFYCAGRYIDEDDWNSMKDVYQKYLNRIYNDQKTLNGNYGTHWATRDYTAGNNGKQIDEAKNIQYNHFNCPALIVHGLNDDNVRTKQFQLMYDAFKNANQNVKLLLHQGAHITPDYDSHKTSLLIGDETYNGILNKWFSHYLYDQNNGAEKMATVTVQSNIVDGGWSTSDTWPTSDEASAYANTLTLTNNETGTTTINSNMTGISSWRDAFTTASTSASAMYTYDVKADTVIKGTVKVNISAAPIQHPDKQAVEAADFEAVEAAPRGVDHEEIMNPDNQVADEDEYDAEDEYGIAVMRAGSNSRDALMMSAMLVDVSDEAFQSYTTSVTENKTGAVNWVGSGAEDYDVIEFKPTTSKYKIIARGWIDLANPGAGFSSASAANEIELEDGTYNNYTVYLQPNYYTVKAGHKLALVVYTYEPGKASYSENYGITIDNAALSAVIPVENGACEAKMSAVAEQCYVSAEAAEDDDYETHGKVTGLESSMVAAGTEVTLTATADSGYDFSGWTVNGEAVEGGATKTFTINSNTTITANFTVHHSSSGGGSSSGSSTTVSASKSDNGSVSIDKTSASKGSTVTVTVKAKDGYKLDKLTITDAKGNTVDVTDKGNGKFSFVMPEGKVTVTPTFVADNGSQTESKSYSDVKTGDWYADAVKYVSDKGLMSGTSADKFAPSATTTRAMLMTVLARYAGEDTTGGATWYEKGMNWAKAKGVSDGTNPNANITREQLVTMMYRYAGSPKADGKLDSFSDAASVRTYAADAMQWAVANGIVNGSNGKLNPQDNATRAEVAAILMRFCEMSK